jgi:hypothetical protein
VAEVNPRLQQVFHRDRRQMSSTPLLQISDCRLRIDCRLS